MIVYIYMEKQKKNMYTYICTQTYILWKPGNKLQGLVLSYLGDNCPRLQKLLLVPILLTYFITNGCKMLSNAFATSSGDRMLLQYQSIGVVIYISWFFTYWTSLHYYINVIKRAFVALCYPFIYCCIQVARCLRGDFASAFTSPAVLHVPLLCQASYTAKVKELCKIKIILCSYFRKTWVWLHFFLNVY